jgi:hypothetical protein
MRRLLVLVLLFLFLNKVGFPLGWYQPNLDLIYCTTRMICLHEQAHQYDYKNGFPSRDPEFRTEIDKIPVIFDLQPGNGEKYQEAYAWFYAIENGDIPFWFEKFYPKGETK